ncbi:MAG: FAD-dependent oxidoreductase [Coriobacteriales bacterium]
MGVSGDARAITRRNLVCGAAAGMALVGGMCAAGGMALADVDHNLDVTEAGPVIGDASVSADDVDWDYEADVVIVGAGGSGLPAGVRALDEGVSVLFVDANYDVGGRAALSGGNLHSGCGTEIQKKYGIEDSPDQYYQDHTTPLTGQARYNDRDYVRSVATYMAEAYQYIQDKGVVVKDTEPIKLPDYTEGGDQPETVPRWTQCDQEAEDWKNYADYKAPSEDGALIDRCGIALTRPLERTAREEGAQFLLNYHMDKIFREGNLTGRVLGVQAHYSPTILPGETEPLGPLSPFSDGNIAETRDTVTVKANKALIIATGGSTGNVYFRTAIDPRRGREYDCTSGDPFCPKDASGEIAAMSIGACLGDIANQVVDDSFLSKAAMIGTQYTDSFATVMPSSPLFKLSRATGLRVYDWSDLLMVNMLGERFADETKSDTEWNAAALASVLTVDPADGELHRYGGPLWTIFDADAVERNGWTIDDTSVDRDDGRFFEADTIEELAGKVVNKYYESVKMDPDTLKATVDRYNELVDKGTDDDFGKEGMKSKIQTPPFYAAWSTPGFHDTTCGLRVNRSMQVLDLFGEVIPGLYCCGESSGGMRIHGLGRVVTSGYIAGMMASTLE